MASNVFPMLSSSPPPIDDCPDDDDDDDEFGTFTSANIPFDSSFDSPVGVEKFKSFKSGDNGVNDTNFSDDVDKFNSFSNSATPSPQEFVPSITDENEPCKNGFTPIKTENSLVSKGDLDISSSEDSDCHSKLQVTSHKPVPLKLESVFYSNNCEHLTSEGCDIQQNSVSRKSVKNKHEKETLKNFGNECDSFKELTVCDSTKVNDGELQNNFCEDESSTHDTCDGPKSFISNSYINNDFSDEDRDLVNEGINLFADKFECDFDSESNENDPEELNNFQESKGLFTTNHFSSNLKKSETELPSESDKKFSDRVPTSDSGSKPVFDNSCEFSDHEFDDFQSCGEKITFVQNAERFGKSNEFQDFQCSSVSNEETEDFADFQDFSATDVANPDDFADFSAVPFDSNKTSEVSGSNEFADFEDATFNTPGESSFQASSASQKNSDPLSTVINAIFPLSENVNDSCTSDETSPQILEQTNKSRRLWEKLHEVEQTPGLRFQWGVSHSFQQLLRSVNVDYHSILRTSSVPIFASGLSLLEPVKGLSNSANHESEDRNQNPKDPIPPVEFDWNSSGLINPLDSGQAASTLMDLSFLSSVESDSNVRSNDHSFENELLKPSPALHCSESTSKSQILEQLLSKNVSSLPSLKTTHRPSDLSEEAVRVLDQLPDLSFMQAKVLMFPISSKT